ncbi:MAG: PaaI family thioesterase [Acidaminococcaceae bacterium]|jgi:acyl-CoA thioesterase|nr:PaaI family thioesterase [Acidaminococcaceae bacterium]
MALTNKEDIEQFIKDSCKTNPFAQTCDIRVDSVKRGEAVLHIDIDDKHTNMYGAAHGGLLATLMDTAMGIVALSMARRVVTLNFNINYIKSIFFCDTATVTARVLHDGMSTMVIEAAVTDRKGDVVCKSTGTIFVVGPVDEVPAAW